MKYLYRKSREQVATEMPVGRTVEIFTPKISNGLFSSGEKRSVKSALVRLQFQFATLGKARIFCLKNDGNLVHTSYVIPKCYRFTYLGKEDYQIGPCNTFPEHRGKGYYPEMLRYICASIGTENTVFHMTVDESNHASIKGIEKAGFQRCGSVKVTKFLKRYYWQRETEQLK